MKRTGSATAAAAIAMNGFRMEVLASFSEPSFPPQGQPYTYPDVDTVVSQVTISTLNSDPGGIQQKINEMISTNYVLLSPLLGDKVLSSNTVPFNSWDELVEIGQTINTIVDSSGPSEVGAVFTTKVVIVTQTTKHNYGYAVHPLWP